MFVGNIKYGYLKCGVYLVLGFCLIFLYILFDWYKYWRFEVCVYVM